MSAGDKVDVVLIRKDGGRSIADVRVENAKVLAIDLLAKEPREMGKLPQAVTLDVTMERAHEILLASRLGRLILRPAGQAKTGLEPASDGDAYCNTPRLARPPVECRTIILAPQTGRPAVPIDTESNARYCLANHALAFGQPALALTGAVG